MALRIFQFSTLFAIGFYLSPTLLYARALDSPTIPLSIDLVDPKDVTVLRGQSATLRCDANSSITGKEVTWFHNNSPVPLDNARWSQREDGSLYIPKVLSGKRANGVTGEYQCLVRNRVGALLSGVAKLKIASMDRDITINLNNYSVPETQPRVLRCSIHSVPPAEYQWEFNNQPLPQHNTRYVPLPNGALLITNTQYDNAGSYRCKATNKILNVTRQSEAALLTVHPQQRDTMPLTFLPLDISPNNTVHIGDKLELYCAVIGWPRPTILWLNKNKLLATNSSVLRVDTSEARLSDEYTCSAYNSMDRINQTFRVEVYQKPQFNVTPVSKSYPAAKIVRLDCHANGVPEPKIYWLKDGQPLTFDTRIKKVSTRIIFSHTFNRDSGIYQCVAVNAAGKIWTAARIEINASFSPRPPEYVQCRPYDSTSVCLSWKPPADEIKAYSVHSFHKVQGSEPGNVQGPEFVVNTSFVKADGLSSSTNYSFYIRAYSKAASDKSETVSCQTGVDGNRNLDILPLNADSVLLKWQEVSIDVSCDGNKSLYKVQWKQEDHSTINVEKTSKHKHTITGLIPGTNYEFRITPISYEYEFDTWTPYTHSDMKNNVHANEEKQNGTGGFDSIPVAPKQLEGVPVSPTSIKLSWLDIRQKKLYTVCYVPVKEEKKCEDGKLTKSYSNKIVISKLKPNTTYEFRVRTHNLEEQVGPFSKSIEVLTPPDVPSAVQDLKYKVVNDTSVCLQWKAPALKNGKLQNYVISYTPNRDRSLEEWKTVTVPPYQRKSKACWLGDEDTVSTKLGNLTFNEKYLVLVRAVTEVGVGKPTVPIVVTTKLGETIEDEMPDMQEDVKYHRKVGIIIGVIIALLCIACCITCILVRRRCLKRRALARVRMAASNNYYPAVAHYTSQVGAVQVRLEDPCAASTQETQQLVSEGHSSHIPPSSSSHLDTKGGEEFPNGHVNGSAKPYMNGHISNGHVHITENPQYYALECNGHTPSKTSKRPPKLRYEEDSNSNVKPSKFYDLYRLFENSKKSNPDYHQCNTDFEQNVNSIKRSNSGSLDLSGDSANDTQLTCLDESLGISVVNNHKKASPILGPNG